MALVDVMRPFRPALATIWEVLKLLGGEDRARTRPTPSRTATVAASNGQRAQANTGCFESGTNPWNYTW